MYRCLFANSLTANTSVPIKFLFGTIVYHPPEDGALFNRNVLIRICDCTLFLLQSIATLYTKTEDLSSIVKFGAEQVLPPVHLKATIAPHLC